MSECDIENCQVVNNHEVLRICCEDLNEQVIQLKKELVLAKREGAKQELELLLNYKYFNDEDKILNRYIEKRLKDLANDNVCVSQKPKVFEELEGVKMSEFQCANISEWCVCEKHDRVWYGTPKECCEFSSYMSERQENLFNKGKNIGAKQELEYMEMFLVRYVMNPSKGHDEMLSYTRKRLKELRK
jgi:hypothetical protein